MKLPPSNSTVNVLVTGVGAIIGYGVIKSLRASQFDCTITGMDIYEDAVGKAWCDKFVQAPYAIEENYIDFLSSQITGNNINLVFFGTEQEIQKCVASRDQMESSVYERLVINTPHLLDLSHDKWKTREALVAHALDHLSIPSVIEGNYASIAALWGDTFLLKPRRSYASKGIHVVHDCHEFDFYKEAMGSNFMAQRIVGDIDHEYTVGVFGLGDGGSAGMIQMQRKLSQEGATAKAKVVFEENLSEAVNALCLAFSPIGPTNMQFRKDGDDFLLLEINPRISSSTSIRAALGFNEAAMCIEYFLMGNVPAPDIRAGSAIRFIDEVVMPA